MTNTRARNRLVTIKQATESTDGSGAAATAFTTTLAQVWARKLGLGSTLGIARIGEFWQAAHMREYSPVIFNIGYLSTVTMGMRIVDGSQTYDIKSVSDPTGFRRELDLVCLEVTG